MPLGCVKGGHFCFAQRLCQLGLTHNIWETQLLFTRSKGNMGEICGLKFSLSYGHKLQRFFFEMPPI